MTEKCEHSTDCKRLECQYKYLQEQKEILKTKLSGANIKFWKNIERLENLNYKKGKLSTLNELEEWKKEIEDKIHKFEIDFDPVDDIWDGGLKILDMLDDKIEELKK